MLYRIKNIINLMCQFIFVLNFSLIHGSNKKLQVDLFNEKQNLYINSKNNRTKLSTISRPVFCAILFFCIIELYQKIFVEKESCDNNKQKQYSDKLKKTIDDGTFLSIISSVYNELIDPTFASIKNNAYIAKEIKDNKIIDKILLLSNTEGKLFSAIFILLSGAIKTKDSVMNIFTAVKSSTKKSLLLIFTLAGIQYKISQSIKDNFGNKLDKIEFLNDRNISKQMISLISLLFIDYYLLTPIYEKYGCTAIAALDELCDTGNSKVVRKINLGSIVNTLMSNPWKESTRENNNISKNKKIFKDMSGLIKSTKILIDIINTLIKIY